MEKTACRNKIIRKMELHFHFSYYILSYFYFILRNSQLEFGLVNKWIELYGSNSGKKKKSNELLFLI